MQQLWRWIDWVVGGRWRTPLSVLGRSARALLWGTIYLPVIFNTPPAGDYAPLGANLAPVTDYMSAYVFIDAFKESREWTAYVGSSPGSWCRVETDAHGWPLRITGGCDNARTFIFWDIGPVYPAGDYILLYDGQATLTYRGDAVKDEARSRTGRHVLRVTPNRGIEIAVSQISATNPIRNIRLYMPGFDETNVGNRIFHPDYLASLRDYGALRFMDWGRTNYARRATGQQTQSADFTPEDARKLRDEQIDFVNLGDPFAVVRWDARAKTTDARYSTDKGVPVETMVQLANELQADPWFTMPHAADNNYIWSFAALVKDRLNSRRRVYVEYSNEVWNVTFGQSEYVDWQAAQRWGVTTNPNLLWQRRLNWYGMQAQQICNIWKQTWGSQNHRVICVAGMQAGHGDPAAVAQQVLDCPLVNPHTGCRAGIDAIAIAPYFGQDLSDPAYQAQLLSWTTLPGNWPLDNLVRQLTVGGALSNGPTAEVTKALTRVQNYAAVAQARGLPLLAYEGGQHLVHGSAAIRALFANTNAYVRMWEVYQMYWQGWRAAGGRLALHYYDTGQDAPTGTWGARRNLSVSWSPKLAAIRDFNQTNPCWWPNCLRAPTAAPAVVTLDSPPFAQGIAPLALTLQTNDLPIHAVQVTLAFDEQIARPRPDGVALQADAAQDVGAVVTLTEGAGKLTVTVSAEPDSFGRLRDGVLTTLPVEWVGKGGRAVWVDSAEPPVCWGSGGQSLPCEALQAEPEAVPTAVSDAHMTQDAPSALLLAVLLLAFTTITGRLIRRQR